MSNLAYHNQALDGIVADIQGLLLAGIPTPADVLPTANVAKTLYFPDLNILVPSVGVSLAPLPEVLNLAAETAGGSLGTDLIGYPCAVTIFLAKNQSVVIDDPDLYWRQQIMSLFHWQRPAGIAAQVGSIFQYSTWEPGNVIDMSFLTQANILASMQIVRVWVRKTRPH